MTFASEILSTSDQLIVAASFVLIPLAVIAFGTALGTIAIWIKSN